jgi:hypothetical protein
MAVSQVPTHFALGSHVPEADNVEVLRLLGTELILVPAIAIDAKRE